MRKRKLKKIFVGMIIGLIFGIIISTIILIPIIHNYKTKANNKILELETALETKNKTIEELSNELLISNSHNSIACYIPDIESVEAMAKTLWGECRGVNSDTEKAAVAWCILNRVDAPYYPNTVLKVVSAKGQFSGYNEKNPITTELKELAIDVLQRWMYEKDHPADYCGRVLPKDYMYFLGDGSHNWFTIEWRGENNWNYTLLSPYEN